MTLCKVHGLNGSSMHGDSGHRTHGIRVGVLALAFVVLALAGCANGGDASRGPVDKNLGAPIATGAPSTAAQALNHDIPPGRTISDGGGGPVQYTFREEWRRALAEAQKWRSGAYLISAVGDMVNDDGVSSHWSLKFIDKADADAVLLVDIDPWGKVTQTREVTGDGVSSFVNQYTKRIPFDVIDSDNAVGIGKAALASRYGLAKTKDPLIALGSSALTGDALDWTYTLFYESTADYVSTQIDALTGDVTPPE